MITVDITVNDEGKVTDVIMDGHADHGEYGHDIVCAGASAVLFGSVNAIIGLTSERPDINYDDNGGHFHIRSVDTNNDERSLSFFKQCLCLYKLLKKNIMRILD